MIPEMIRMDDETFHLIILMLTLALFAVLVYLVYPSVIADLHALKGALP